MGFIGNDELRLIFVHGRIAVGALLHYGNQAGKRLLTAGEADRRCGETVVRLALPNRTLQICKPKP